jgi:hypothetical protein
MQGLYRGKGLTNGIWAFGYFVKNESNGNCYIYVPSNKGATPVLVAPETVGQMLHELGDTMVYEYDMLHIEIRDYMTGKVIASGREVVKVKDCKIGVEWGNHRNFTALTEFCNTTMAVVGNIHDNPELLGGAAYESHNNITAVG